MIIFITDFGGQTCLSIFFNGTLRVRVTGHFGETQLDDCVSRVLLQGDPDAGLAA